MNFLCEIELPESRSTLSSKLISISWHSILSVSKTLVKFPIQSEEMVSSSTYLIT